MCANRKFYQFNESKRTVRKVMSNLDAIAIVFLLIEPTNALASRRCRDTHAYREREKKKSC